MEIKPRKPFYITTTLPYVNAEAHLGHAMEFVRADIIARAMALGGFDVLFNTGTDEHGLKIHRKAEEQGIPTQAYVDGLAGKFRELLPLLGIGINEPTEGVFSGTSGSLTRHFIRTTDAKHRHAAQEFWKLCASRKAPDGQSIIYKKNYQIKYCVGCELEKTDSELVDGKCPIHPKNTIEIIDEENYFFRFSAFAKPLLALYAERPDFVIPDFRFNEIKAFVERGLEDFSISRFKTKMPWGVEVPGDPQHVMYVWFDALTSYISNLGWPDDAAAFDKWWKETGGVVQYCGKDNLRQQSAMWQAMLMAAGLPPSRQIAINGFITAEGGVKMSKSIGNTVDPLDLIRDYGTDALRFYVAHELSMFEDSPVTIGQFKDSYNAALANGLGNLVSRVMKMAEANGVVFDEKIAGEAAAISAEAFASHLVFYKAFQINKAVDDIWQRIQAADKFIQTEQPFRVVKVDAEKGKAQIAGLLRDVYVIGALLAPVLPETSAKISACVKAGKMPSAGLFLRKD